ncbi:S-layer homology domain-containing protein [Pseudoneobacillus sp. C159]
MGIYKKWLKVTIAWILTFSLLSPATMAEEVESVVPSEQGPLSLSIDDPLAEQWQAKSGILWSNAEFVTSLTYERILSLWQTGQVDRNLLKAKARPSILGETLSNYSNAVMLLAVTQSNPFAYEGNNFASKLSNSQTGEGYFSFSEPSSYNNDRKADPFVNALFALEFIGANYNRETALHHLKTVLPDIKSATNGLLLGLTVSALANYESEEAEALREELLTHYKESGTYFTQGLGLYVDNLYALGEDPLNEKWHIKIKDDQYISVLEAYSNLIHTSDSYAFFNRLKAGEVTGQSNETLANSHWSLIGLTSLVKRKSMIQDAREQFKNLDFDFSPKTIEATNVTLPYLVKGTIFKPLLIAKDQYQTPRNARFHLQSSNPAVLEVNEKNELVSKQSGQAAVTVTVEGYESVRKVLSFTVMDDAQLSPMLPKIEKGIGHLTKQTKLSSFEDAVALKTFGYESANLVKIINLYHVNGSSTSTSQDAFNAARNVLSLKAAGLDPYTYNGTDYVGDLHKQLANVSSIAAEHAAHIFLAQFILDEIPADKVTSALLAELVEKDGLMYIQTLGSPDVSRTAKVLQAITLINNERLVTTENSALFLEAEEKIVAFYQSNYSEGKFNKDAERNAVAVLNYLSLKQQTDLGDFDIYGLANIVLQNQYNNAYITNGMIPNLSGLQSESTGIGLNALSYLLTNKNAYSLLKQKNSNMPTTIKLELPEKVKVNVPFALTGRLLDQNGNEIDTDMNWTVNGEPSTGTFTATEVGSLHIRAEAKGVSAEKIIDVIDYQKVFSLKINPIDEAVTDKDIQLSATVNDSEGEEVTDATITWTVEGPDAIVNGSVVRFNKPGSYILLAQAEGMNAKALEIQVARNPESIQTHVVQAVDRMKQYLENKGQFDYISALAYSRVINNPELSQLQMRSIGHLREYGHHDEKYALYYAKNILQAVATSENPKQFKTYKGPVVDLVTPLVNSQDADGHFTMFANFDKASVATQAWSIIALDLIQEPYQVELAIRDLLKGLNGPILEGSYKEPELRALALIALSKHRDIAGVNQQITSILNFLKSQQNEDAGFNYGGYTNNPFAIGTIIQGLVAVGENPYDAKWKKNGRTMVEALLTQQIKNGGFKFGDEFEPEYEFDELKSTEAAFGALADLYTKASMFNESAKIIDPLPEINKDTKPFIDIAELELKNDQPLLSVSVTAFDNIDGELTPTVTLNDITVYSTENTYKAIVHKGVNYLEITAVNSQGNKSVETIPVLFQSTATQPVPQANVKVTGLNGASMYAKTVVIEENDTAYSVLVKAIGKKNITSRPFNGSVYIMGINGLEELDHGPGSGWMYRVNGVFPKVFAGQLHLKDGDTLEWLYTTNLGKDIGATEPDSSEGSGNDTTTGGNKPSTDEDALVIETSTKNIQAEINVAKIRKALQEDKRTTLTIKNNAGAKVELPKALLLSDIFSATEKLIVGLEEIVEEQDHVIQLKLETVNQNGVTKNMEASREYMKLTIPVKGMTSGTVVLQLVNGDYQAVPHTIVNGDIVILTKTGGTFVVTKETVTFKDITNTFNKEEIEYLASRHVIKGENTDEFAPNKPITRAQFAVMISRALGLQALNENHFSDTKGKWYEQDVQALLEAGITTGSTATTFEPEKYITRQQAAAFMARILAYVNYQAPVFKEANFKDLTSISPEFKEHINLLNSLNIMTGKTDNTFDPNNLLTRAQMAKILKRTLHVAKLM